MDVLHWLRAVFLLLQSPLLGAGIARAVSLQLVLPSFSEHLLGSVSLTSAMSPGVAATFVCLGWIPPLPPPPPALIQWLIVMVRRNGFMLGSITESIWSISEFNDVPVCKETHSLMEISGQWNTSKMETDAKIINNNNYTITHDCKLNGKSQCP